MAGQQHRPALARVRLQPPAQVPQRVRIEPGRRLVEQQHVRPRQQRDRQRQPAPLPVRARPHALVGEPLHPGQVRGSPRPRRGQRQLIAHQSRGMKPVLAEHPVHPPARDRAPARRAREAEQDPQRRRLPAPLGPRNPHTLPCGTAKDSPSTAVVRP